MNHHRTLTAVSYNICHGHLAQFDWERLAAPIRALAPDVIGVQEVDMFTNRSRNMDTLSALAAGYHMPASSAASVETVRPRGTKRRF